MDSGSTWSKIKPILIYIVDSNVLKGHVHYRVGVLRMDSGSTCGRTGWVCNITETGLCHREGYSRGEQGVAGKGEVQIYITLLLVYKIQNK